MSRRPLACLAASAALWAAACQLLSGGSGLEVGEETVATGGTSNVGGSDGGGGEGGAGAPGGAGGAGGEAPVASVCADGMPQTIFYEGNIGTQYALAVAPLHDGGCLVGGGYDGTFRLSDGTEMPSGQHGFLLRFAPDAEAPSQRRLMWSMQIPDRDVLGIVLGEAGEVFIRAGENMAIVMRIDDETGASIWETSITSDETMLLDMATGNGHLWLGGSFASTFEILSPLGQSSPLATGLPGRNGFIVAVPYDFSDVQDAAFHAPTCAADCGVKRVAVSPDGAAVGAAGEFEGAISFAGQSRAASDISDVFLLHLDGDGNAMTLQSAASNGADTVEGLVITDTDVFMAGTFAGGRFEVAPGVEVVRSVEDVDIWFASWRRSPVTVNWLRSIHKTSTDLELLDVEATANGDFVMLATYGRGTFLSYENLLAQPYPALLTIAGDDATIGALAEVEVGFGGIAEGVGLHVSGGRAWLATGLSDAPIVQDVQLPSPPSIGHDAAVLSVQLPE